MFNDEQKDHMNWLSENPDKVCGCGWYSKEECITSCSNPGKRRVEENRLSKLILAERERCARIVDEYCRTFYDLQNPDATMRNRTARFHLNTVADKIRRLEYDPNRDRYRIP